MTNEDGYASCDGRPQILHWKINRHLFYSFEIDTDVAERTLPDRLQIVELRPGVALMSVGVLRYEPALFGPDAPGFFELVGAVHVSPDLSFRMPLPSMTFAAFQVLSDSKAFVDQEEHTLYTPAHLVPSLQMDFTPDQLGATVYDDEGPILEMPSAHPEPRWVEKEMWGQHYTNTKGLHSGIWQWDGRMFEHQKPIRGWKLHPHSFWQGIDVSKVRACYRTMVQEPDTICHERFFAMRAMEPVTGGAVR
jgi:hypothetical protein